MRRASSVRADDPVRAAQAEHGAQELHVAADVGGHDPDVVGALHACGRRRFAAVGGRLGWVPIRLEDQLHAPARGQRKADAGELSGLTAVASLHPNAGRRERAFVPLERRSVLDTDREVIDPGPTAADRHLAAAVRSGAEVDDAILAPNFRQPQQPDVEVKRGPELRHAEMGVCE